MKKISKFISLILSVGILPTIVCLNVNAEKYYNLNEFECIDTATYFDEHPYFKNYTILKQKKYGIYYLAFWEDNTIKMNTGSIEFLCYLLDTDEKYNAMSEYLAEKYPEYSLKHISEAGELSLKYGMGNYIIDTGKEMSEKEIFELATEIKNDIGYYFEIAIHHYVSDELDCSGDVNCDFSISMADVVAVSAYVANAKKNSLEEQSIINGDVYMTGDGLNANDALMIQQYATGIIDSLS